MERLKKVTGFIILGVTVFLLGYDLIAVLKTGATTAGATISAIMFNWGHQYPVIPFLWGLLMGHFFWSQEGS